ncbi:MAG TPA: beta-propeller fold lactonase family protein [bacterium]|nr:beta-propeller fold lactonase family protein [bacterium]HPR86994.1 beta-propeller fold lactonase family protein [bacterium]
MKKVVLHTMTLFTLLAIALQASPLPAQSLSALESSRVALPNGWKLTPVGRMVRLGDLPLNVAVSPSKKLLAITNNGQSDQSIQLFDRGKNVVIDSAAIGKAWVGLAFSADEKSLYVSGGNDNWIIRYDIVKGKLTPADTLVLGKPWPELISVAGIALDDGRHLLYAVTRENNSLYTLDTRSGRVLARFPLGGEAYTCLLAPDRATLYISCWGANKVVLFDAEQQQLAGSIAVGDNPNALCLSQKGDRLFVANANDNSVSVIDTRTRKVVETLNTALFPQAPSGSTANGLALSADDRTLYVANADNNCLAVFDVAVPGASVSRGFIPTGWYPTCVQVVAHQLYIANGKGLSSAANPFGPNPAGRRAEVGYQQGSRQKEQYIGGLFRGVLAILDEPDAAQLGVYSRAVYANTPYTKSTESESEGEPGNPVPMRIGDSSPIKYVFYVIKENRTYDQVLGDMPEGNGDTTLVLFGDRISPNHHALAREFVLLDNFYVNGEVSADGHNWSLGAYATDYLEKTWPTSYGKRGGFYTAEGNREIANPRDGFLWDFCKRYGVSYRTYGEFADDYKPNIPALKDHFCPYYTSWDQTVRDTTRFYQWKKDFDSLYAAGQVPQLNTLRLINDHTEGLAVGRPTPFAHVADNDLALGLFIDYLSHHPIWNQTAVFIVEDDAQNGPDHVDAHRSVALIAGGFVKTGLVDHTMYSTTSMLRTIELILGLPPMSQYDAAATPMWRCFAHSAGHAPYSLRPISVDLNDRNVKASKWSELSGQFDWSKEDRCPDGLFNEVIWRAVKGLDSPCPPPVHAAFFLASGMEEEEED